MDKPFNNKRIPKPSKNNLGGTFTDCGDLPFEVAFRKFRKKVESTGLLREVKERMHYDKPTTVRKQKKNAAVKRWQREQLKHKLPPKLY